jgi:hypothetical protein
MIHRDSCTGKQAYDDEPSADRAARALHYKRHSEVHPYHCKKCNKWHLGSKPEKVERRDRKKRRVTERRHRRMR